MPPNPRVINVLGVAVSEVDYPGVWALTAAWVAEKRKGYVCVTGVHGVSEAQKSSSFRDVLNGAALNVPDGMPMVWVGKACGSDLISRVYGPDLMLEICGRGVDLGLRHFLYGGADGVASRLQEALEARFPGIQVVGTFTPPFRPLNQAEGDDLVLQVAAARPDIVWVGLSTPKQERFMADFLDRLDTTIMFGVGAAFDFHTGRVPQAPAWMQKAGLEWFFRMMVEPRRLAGRYLRNNPAFVARLAKQALRPSAYRLPGELAARSIN